jgi:hypothetical protein
MPLGDFAEAVKSAGTSARVMGERGFANFERSLNKAMISHGMYAMTLDQINKFSGQYLETSRRAGLVTGKNNTTLSKSFVELAGTTSALSNITGKARDDIMNLAQLRCKARWLCRASRRWAVLQVRRPMISSSKQLRRWRHSPVTLAISSPMR